ncbi:hypothetical protein, partial [Mesonia sp. HuA40]|uniref:hypothetical protein n=1 Tax=Mesonia sp. HuA40 TaxID=2602761 RepID=UPI001C9BE214
NSILFSIFELQRNKSRVFFRNEIIAKAVGHKVKMSTLGRHIFFYNLQRQPHKKQKSLPCQS